MKHKSYECEYFIERWWNYKCAFCDKIKILYDFFVMMLHIKVFLIWYVKLWWISESKCCLKNLLTIQTTIASEEEKISKLKLI